MSLPSTYTQFVGRERELADVQSALQRARLVTLTGPGGCGKTRLALEYARRQTANASHVWVGDACWCELAAVTEPDYVPARLAAALGLAEHPDRSPTDLITEALGAQPRLLILDNCEHLLAACAALAEAILAACPGVTILATSIQLLGSANEQPYRVPPLAVPAPPERVDAALLSTLTEFDAVRLFLTRARELFPAFELTPQNIAAVITICQRVDALPLAIELAAARVKLLAPAQIIERLEDAFALLTRGQAEAAPRHQTLRATLDWSRRRLSPAEQTLLWRLSVFAGAFDLEMVEAVCSTGLPAAPLDVLADLVDKSLVAIVEHEAAGVRYGLLGTIRQYAREQLSAAGARDALAQRHLNWCVDLAEQTASELEGAAQGAGLARLEREHDNIRAALEFAIGAGRIESGLRLAGALQRYWWIRGHPTEGRRWFKQLLRVGAPGSAGGEAAVRPAVLARALVAAGDLALRQHDANEAEASFQKSFELRQALGDQAGAAWALHSLGSVAIHRGDFARAAAVYAQSLVRQRASGDLAGIGSALVNLGAVYFQQGDYARAAGFFEEGLVTYREVGDQLLVAVALNNLGEVAKLQGDWPRAESLLRETLALRRVLGDKRGAALALANLAEVPQARQDWPAARALYREALGIFQGIDDRRGMAQCFAGLAFVAAAPQRAAQLLGMAAGLREAIRLAPSASESAGYAEIEARLRGQMDEQVFAEAWTVGRAQP
ncbi:MAG: tetratricopeptide repeat protein, partial [Anaerolineales bacterium]